MIWTYVVSSYVLCWIAVGYIDTTKDEEKKHLTQAAFFLAPVFIPAACCLTVGVILRGLVDLVREMWNDSGEEAEL